MRSALSPFYLTSLEGRYARSLFEAPGETDPISAQQVYASYEALYYFFQKEEDFFHLLSRNVLTEQQHMAIAEELREVFALSSHMFSFWLVLLKNGRLNLFQKIFKIYRRLYLESQNIHELTVEYAGVLTESQKEQLEEACKKMFNCKELLVTYKENNELIAGLRIYDDYSLVEANVDFELKKLKRI